MTLWGLPGEGSPLSFCPVAAQTPAFVDRVTFALGGFAPLGTLEAVELLGYR